jgi:hypothetical protein
VRAPAAWNARAALAGRTAPTLVIADHFGDGAPGAGTDITLTGGAFADNARSSDHGYMVLGITSGSYDATGTGSVADEAVTGMFPGTLRVRAADVTAGLAGAVLHDRMLELVEASPGDVVLNTSLSGWPCETQEEAAAYCTEEFAAEAGAVWAEKVRGTDPGSIGTNLEGAFVHATSAGNVEDVTGALGAPVNSEWTAATLLPLEDAGGVPIPNLSNTLVVENVAATTTEPFRPGCVAPSSEFGGTVAGVGSPVHSFQSPTASDTYADGGTSAATPQVAGLAAYVWTLAPTLTPAQLAALLERSARPSDCDGTRVIDAYAALLASAVPAARTAILDVADAAGEAGADGRFDGNDLDEFLAGFQALDGKIDYGRFDLNGDGVTRAEPGVTRRDRVALTADDTFTEVAHDVDGVTAWFDERSLSDENVLCYAAYSPLWQGTAAERTEDLGPESCVRPHVSHTFPQSVTTGVSNTLTISVSSLELLDAAGEPMPVEDVHLELAQSDGVTLGAASGRTNADGVFTTSVSVAEGQTALTIDVTAYDDPGGHELGSDTVSATVDLPGVASIGKVEAEIWVRDGEDEDDRFLESSGGWSLSGGAGGTSVSAGASVVTEGGVVRYGGAGTIRTTGGEGLIGSHVTVNVTGGPVRWFLTQRVQGAWVTGSLAGGCYIDNQFVGIVGGGRSGVWQPGTNFVSHNCGGGGPGIDVTMEWTLTVGG